MVLKADLVKQAEALGLDPTGTKAELEDRIAEAAIADIDEEDVVAPVAEVPKPLVKAEPKPKQPVKVREAIPSAIAKDLVTRTALKSTVKFIGRWYTLRKGKPLTAPKNVIDSLAQGGFVEKK